MRRPTAALVLTLTLAACSSREERERPVEKPKGAPPAPAPAATPARPSGLDASALDPAVRPQDDLFRAVNGAWLAKAEIPADRSTYGSFAALADRSEADVRALLDGLLARDKSPPEGSEEQKIGDLYADFLDEAKVEALGVKPIADELAAVSAIATPADLARVLGSFRRVGISGPFRIHVGVDAKHSDRHILTLGQDGLGLPDRDYYLVAKYREKLAAYEPHVAKVLALAGVPDADTAAKSVVGLEAAIAQAHWPKEDNRDDTKTYNKLTRAALAELCPGFDWAGFFEAAKVPATDELVVAQPSYFKALGELVGSQPLEAWKAWLSWRIVHHRAELLPKGLVAAEFAFYGKKLRGTLEERPRWKRAVGTVQHHLGEAVGKLYVAKHFPPEAKERMDALVANVVAAYGERIRGLDWMSPATKEKALAKLATFMPKVGHTKKWRDYSRFEVKRGDLVGNVRRSSTFEWERTLAKLGSPVDRDEWHMTPQTVNAYYNSSLNEIVFPAAILQPPFFDLAADDAVNYGGIGAVIGHEIGHGFDDQGSKWDGDGNLSDWWTKEDRAEFDKRTAALVAQYERFELFPGFHVNGRLTLGENIGDLAGVTVAHAAYRRSLGGKPAPVIDGRTGEQRFFMGFAQIWRGKAREDEQKTRLATDPHSPAECRANGPVRNVEAFYEAFEVKPGDKLYLPPEERVRIW